MARGVLSVNSLEYVGELRDDDYEESNGRAVLVGGNLWRRLHSYLLVRSEPCKVVP